MILAGVELIMWRTLYFVPHQLKFSYESQLISGPLMLQANHQNVKLLSMHLRAVIRLGLRP